MSSKTMPDELMDCPFCGKYPDFSTLRDGEDEYYIIECLNSQCEVRGVKVSGFMGDLDEGFEIWNDRTDDKDKTIRELAEVLKFLINDIEWQEKSHSLRWLNKALHNNKTQIEQAKKEN